MAPTTLGSAPTPDNEEFFKFTLFTLLTVVLFAFAISCKELPFNLSAIKTAFFSFNKIGLTRLIAFSTDIKPFSVFAVTTATT